jgi:capsid protein
MYKVRVTWNPQAWPYINPLQDVQTSMKAVDSGLSSRTREIMKRGDDPDQVDAERKADQDRAVRLRLI